MCGEQRLSNLLGFYSDMLLQIATAEGLADGAHPASHATVLHVAHESLLQRGLCDAGIWDPRISTKKEQL